MENDKKEGELGQCMTTLLKKYMCELIAPPIDYIPLGNEEYQVMVPHVHGDQISTVGDCKIKVVDMPKEILELLIGGKVGELEELSDVTIHPRHLADLLKLLIKYPSPLLHRATTSTKAVLELADLGLCYEYNDGWYLTEHAVHLVNNDAILCWKDDDK